jgi:hypothetical protein
MCCSTKNYVNRLFFSTAGADVANTLKSGLSISISKLSVGFQYRFQRRAQQKPPFNLAPKAAWATLFMMRP